MLRVGSGAEIALLGNVARLLSLSKEPSILLRNSPPFLGVYSKRSRNRDRLCVEVDCPLREMQSPPLTYVRLKIPRILPNIGAHISFRICRDDI